MSGRKTLVIGFGNPLREDDGAGHAVANRLGPPAVAVVQLTPELADRIARAMRVVFVDADRSGPAGWVTRRRLDPGKAEAAAFSHHATPEGLLAAAKVLHGRLPEAWLVTIGGERFGWGERLSPAVEAAVSAVAEELRGWSGEEPCTTRR